MTPTLLIFIWLAIIEAKVLIDFYQIVHLKKSPKHGLELGAVVFVYIFYAGLAGGVRAADTWAQDLTVFCASTYWFLFDGLLSKHRGLDWFYLSESKEGAGSDRFWTKMGARMYIGSKFVMVPLIIYGLVWIYRHQF